MHSFSRVNYNFKTEMLIELNVFVSVPVFRVRTEERCEHHHLILTGDDLSDCEDLVLCLWMADVQHCGRARFILSQSAFSPMSHLHGIVWRQLTLYILCWCLGNHREF